MGTVKDRYSKDLIEVEEIKVRCKNTEELYKNVLMIWITTTVWSLT